MTTAIARREATLPPATPSRPVRRFTLAEYHRMIEVGVLKPSDPYELLNGVIAYKMPQNTPHASAAAKLEKRFWRLLGDDWLLRTQKPISIPRSESEPEPDLAVVVGPDDRYDDSHPTPREVALVVEVADTSLPEDRGEKLAVYAAAKLPEYWVVNLRDRKIEVYTDPRGGKSPTYRNHTDYLPGQSVPVVVGGKTLGSIPVSEFLS